jgi:hypothetical protein
MNANELADMLAKSSIRKVSQGEVVVDIFEIATMLRQQQAEIAELEIGLKNVWKVVENKQVEIEALKEQLEDCTCQGGHSEAYLKAKGKLK